MSPESGKKCQMFQTFLGIDRRRRALSFIAWNSRGRRSPPSLRQTGLHFPLLSPPSSSYSNANKKLSSLPPSTESEGASDKCYKMWLLPPNGWIPAPATCTRIPHAPSNPTQPEIASWNIPLSIKCSLCHLHHWGKCRRRRRLWRIMAPLLTPPPLFQTAEEVPSLHVMTRSFFPITGVTNIFLTLCKCGIIRSQIGFTYSSLVYNQNINMFVYIWNFTLQ